MRRREFISLLGGAAIVRQATNLRDLELPMLLPGIRSTPVRPTTIRCNSCT